MNFDKLQLRNFRNISELDLKLEPGLNLFIGDNGQGKTNLIEALFMSCRGVSFRPSESGATVRFGAVSGHIRSHANKANLDYDVELRFNTQQRALLLNGKKISRQRIIEIFPVVLFSPESLNAIKEGPELRRELVDDCMVTLDSNKLDILQKFKKALATRNKILKDFKLEKANQAETLALLHSLDPLYFPLAAMLTVARIQILNKLQASFQNAVKYFFPNQTVDSSVDYLISDHSALEMDYEQVHDALRKRAQDLIFAELSAGNSLVGPHKHDIKISFDQKDSRYYCSQGQQRALILAFKMAQIQAYKAQYHEAPVLLLDDVMSELDPFRRSHLLEFLRQNESQVLLTTTDLNLAQPLLTDQVAVFEVREGRVTRKE